MTDERKMSRAWIELDLEALRHNVRLLQGRLPEGCQLAAVVKANAYGHGAAPVARTLAGMGISMFCVATVDEAVELRRNGIRGTILILGYTPASRFKELAQYDLTQTAVDLEHARVLAGFVRSLRVQLAVDTGMHRLGAPWQHGAQIAAMLQMRNLRVTGVYTHLCVDDWENPEIRAFAGTQAARFQSLLAQLHRQGLFPQAHLLDSCGLLHGSQYGGSYARIGIALYGVSDGSPDLPLRPVLALKARIALVRTVPAGDGVGYGLDGKSDRDRRIAVVTIGYADGVPRSLSCGRGKILVHGKAAPIVGRICMDQMMVDVSEIPEVKPGDTAVLIGTSGGRTVTARELAEAAGTISNELLSCLGPRLERIIED